MTELPCCSMALLRNFLQVADKVKPGVWIVKDQWVKKHGLSTEVPEGVQMPASERPATR